MEFLGNLKLNWVNIEIEKLTKTGLSKAQIAEKMGISPQQLNNTINSKSGASDKFVEKFIETFAINDFNLSYSIYSSEEKKYEQIISEIAGRFSDICTEIQDLPIAADAFGVSCVELSNFTSGHYLPKKAFNCAKFLSLFPEFNYSWLITGIEPMFVGDSEGSRRSIRRRVHKINHPEYYKDEIQILEESPIKKTSSDNLWDQIHFQNEQLKEKDAQIKQLLDILQKK